MSQIIGEKEVFRGDWVVLKNIVFRNKAGEHVWEAVHKMTRDKSGADIDAVEVLPLIHHPVTKKETEIILERIFRPAIKGYSIEMPAGLVERGETDVSTAVRELQEETGYTAHEKDALPLDPLIVGSPSIADTVSRYVRLDINGDTDENETLTPHLEKEEDIEAFVVPLSRLMDFLKERSALGDRVEGRLFTFAYGLVCKDTI